MKRGDERVPDLRLGDLQAHWDWFHHDMMLYVEGRLEIVKCESAHRLADWIKKYIPRK